jgi:hypothetical protein
MRNCRDLFENDKPVSYELPVASSCTICYWGGGSTSGASDAIMAGQNQAINAQQQALAEAKAAVAPWQRAGSGAVGQIAGLLNIPGYTALDPTTTLTGTPGYKFLQDQGTQALSRYGAATGLGASGAAMKGALNYGQNLAQTYAWQPYMSSLQNLSGQGLQAGGMTGNWATQTGLGEANTYMTGANQLAQLEMQKANSQNSWMGDLMSGLGFVGSLAAAPFTGGASLGGALGSISGMFSGSNAAGALNQMPGMSTGQLYSGFSGSNQAFDASSGGGWVPAFMADGGPVEHGRPYIVGERGPELIYPEHDGYVIPNHLMPYSAFEYHRMAA